MCGRYVSSSTADEISAYFDIEAKPEKVLQPNFNVAPTTDVYSIIEADGRRRLEVMHWGLVPFWAKDPSIGNRMINARADTVATKNSFRQAFAKRRCIIPVDGFYEWEKVEGQKKKQPYFIHRPDDAPFAFAGLYEIWRPSKDSDEELISCTILTGEPNSKMAEIHHRMPILLDRGDWARWLDPDNHDTESLGELLVPASSELISYHPVSTEVNNVRNKGTHLIEEAPRVGEESTDSDSGPLA